MRYYIIYSKNNNGCAIIKMRYNIVKRGPDRHQFKDVRDEVKPLGKSEEEMWLRWVLDGYITGAFLGNKNVHSKEDFAANRMGWHPMFGSDEIVTA